MAARSVLWPVRWRPRRPLAAAERVGKMAALCHQDERVAAIFGHSAAKLRQSMADVARKLRSVASRDEHRHSNDLNTSYGDTRTRLRKVRLHRNGTDIFHIYHVKKKRRCSWRIFQSWFPPVWQEDVNCKDRRADGHVFTAGVVASGASNAH